MRSSVCVLSVGMSVAIAALVNAQTVTNGQFVNGFTINGASTDLSSGSLFDRRLGFFSDIYYDPNRNEWWALSDRGPGGGMLPYETRVERFTLERRHHDWPDQQFPGRSRRSSSLPAAVR